MKILPSLKKSCFLERKTQTPLQMIHRSDWLALAGMFVLGATVGAAFIQSTQDAFFYQQFTPEIVMWACGRGLLYVVDKPAGLLDFLFGRQPAFDCGALDLVRHAQAPGFFFQTQPYLDMAVGVLWRTLGVSYAALWPIFALLHGAYGAGCFALARLFYRLPLALGLGIIATLSPVAVGMLFALRDYSKAPFFIWCIVLLLLALRSARPSQAILCGALAGLVVGVGTGFRSDTMMLVPIGALLPLIGSNAALSSWRVRAGFLRGEPQPHNPHVPPLRVHPPHVAKGLQSRMNFRVQTLTGMIDDLANYPSRESRSK